MYFNKNQFDNRVETKIRPLWLLLLVLLLLTSWGSVVKADTITVDCPDLDDPSSCLVSPTDTRGSIIDLIRGVKDCKLDEDANEAICDTDSGSTISCTGLSGEGASCNVNGVATLECNELNEGQASCELTTKAGIEIMDDFTGTPLTPNGEEVVRVIANICGKGNVSSDLQRDCDQLVANAEGENAGVANALVEITPDSAAAPTDVSQQSIQQQKRNITRRLQEVRQGATGFSMNGLRFAGFHGNYDGGANSLYGRDVENYLEESGGSAGDSDKFSRISGFLNGLLGIGDKENTSLEEGFSFDTVNLTLGIDYRFQNDVVGGVALGYSHTETEFTQNGGDLSSDAFSVMLYGSFNPADNIYVDASGSFGGNDYEQTRHIDYALVDQITGSTINVNQNASASYLGDNINLFLGGGYLISQGALSLSPFAEFQYVSANVDGYREDMSNVGQPGSGWSVSFNDQEFESMTIAVGGSASYAISQPWGVLLPHVRIDWVNELNSDALVVSGHFVGDPNKERFNLGTDTPDDNYFNVEAGVSSILARGLSLFFNTQALVGYDNLTQYAFTAGVRSEF